MVQIEGRKYLDGALADSIPVKFFQQKGYDRNVVVLTRPKSFVMKKSELMPLIRLKYRQYPKLVAAMEKRHRIYNETLAMISGLERNGKLLVIRPDSPLPVSRVEKNPEKLRQAYEVGRQTAMSRLPDLHKYLGLD